MKKKYYLMALAAFVLASCSEDTDPFAGGRPGENPESRVLSFVFPGTAKGVVPYSATASAPENELKTLDIYVFGEDTTSSAPVKPMVLEEVFKSGVSGEYDFTTSGSDKTAKISVYAGNKKCFYFVANGRDHLSLDSIRLNVTDTAAFVRKVTNLQPGLLECPLLMSGFHDMPDVADAIAGGAIEVELKRRVARFDLLNNSDDSGFIIHEIQVTNARGGNYIFDGNAAPYAAPLIESLPIIDFSPFPNANYGESNSVVYTYPTVTAGEMELALVGKTAGGAPQVYPVKLKPSQTDDDTKLIQIKANSRYLLSVLSLGTGYINATLKVTEWIVGDTINNQTGYGTIKLSDKDGKELKDSTISIAAEALLTDSVLINVAASSEWELFVDPKYDWIGVSELPRDTVMRSFKVTTTAPNPGSKEARMATVVVRNRQRPSIMQTLLIKQDKNTTRYIDLAGKRLQGNMLKFSGEVKDSINVDLDVPAGTAWTATEKSTWFNIGEKAIVSYAADFTTNTPQSGTGAGSISIFPEANTTEDARQDTVTITIAGTSGQPDLVQRLIVYQAPRNLGSIQLRMVGVKDEKITIEAAGFSDTDGKRDVKVIANTAWKVETSEAWLTISEETGNTTGNGSFRIEAAANTAIGAVERTATLTVVNTIDPNIKKTITITQKAAPAAISISASVSDVNLLQDGTAQDVTITTTDAAGWEIDGTPDAWITTAIDGNKLTISAGANADFTEKSGSVVVKSKTDPTKQATITVKQAPTKVTITKPSDITGLAADQSTPDTRTVNVTCNDTGNWTVSNNSADNVDEANWLTTTKNGDDITVTATTNASGTSRTAIVTVTSTTQPGVTATFTVSQD